MIKTPQSIDSIKATLKRFDEEEAALRNEFSQYPKKNVQAASEVCASNGSPKESTGLA